jgi:hypothetical protein
MDKMVQVGGIHMYRCAVQDYTLGTLTGASLLRGGALQQAALWSIRPPWARTSATPQHIPAPMSNVLNIGRIYLHAAIQPHGGLFSHHQDTLTFRRSLPTPH